MGGASSRKAAPPPIQDSNPPASLQKATVSGRKGSIDQQSNSKHRTQIHIFFGSHGGTAEQFTYNLKSTLNSKGDYCCIPARIINLDEFNPRQLTSCSVALVLIATHGEGEPTDSSQEFIEWVENRDGKSANHLAGVEFAVFGLGDRTYQHFNRMGKLTQASLEKLGAHPIHPLTEGDASVDIDHDYENWRDAILPMVKEYHDKRAVAPASSVIA